MVRLHRYCSVAALSVLTSCGIFYRIHHVDVGLRAGLTPAQLAVIRDTSTALKDEVDPSSVLTEPQRACLAYTDWMTRNIGVPHPIFESVRVLFDPQNIVEITETVGCYNMVSRFLVALDVGDMADAPVPDAPSSS